MKNKNNNNNKWLFLSVEVLSAVALIGDTISQWNKYATENNIVKNPNW